MEVLRLDNVSKKIGSRRIVDNLNMSIQKGEVYGFLGPNGAGKTTTIRMIVGLIKPSKGSVRILGHDVQQERRAALSHVGAIVENPEVYSYLSGRKNLLHYARLAGISSTKINIRIREVVEQVKLTDRIDDKVKTYSLGMRQRLGLAQALLGNPQLLILDEPTNGLDPAGMREFRQLIRSIAETGIAVFVSSHLLSEIQQMCDRVAIIKEGRILTEQRVDDLLNQAAAESVTIKVNHEQAARAILEKQGWKVRRSEGKQLEVAIKQEQTPLMIRLLVLNNIDLYSVEPNKESLEETFLEMTKEEHWKGENTSA